MAGKLFGGVITLVGISMVALPTGIIASGFSNEFQRKNKQYKNELEEAFADGGLTEDELQDLQKLQGSLGLSEEDTKNLYQETLANHLKKHEFICVQCQKKLHE